MCRALSFNTKKIIVVLAILFIGGIFITILHKRSRKRNSQKNGFTRVFLPKPLSNPNLINLEHNSYYIAGVSAGKIFLGNITAPQYLLTLNASLNDTQYSKIDTVERLNLVKARLQVDSPWIYIKDVGRHQIFVTRLDNCSKAVLQAKNTFFADAAPISNFSSIIRTFGDRKSEYALAKISSDAMPIYPPINLLEKQVDGMFCTDGMLHYDSKLARLLYVYYYRNQFLFMDSNLHLIYKGTTVDTNTKAKINVANIKEHKEITLSTPPFIVNRNSCISRERLFIESGLRADNEVKALFGDNSVIDVYDLSDGKYNFSFYIPKLKGTKAREFRVFGNTLFVLYDYAFYSFSLNFSK